MVFAVATNNPGKLAQIRRILSGMGHTVRSLADLGEVCDAEETGATFSENARIKADALCRLCGIPTIADDSGLCVDALNGAPGVFSARYCGHHGDDEANNEKLLEILKDIPAGKRQAHFISAVCLAMPDGRHLNVTGECTGRIGFVRRGANGFGYDPIFYVREKSYAEMSDAEKDLISHRGKALREFERLLPSFLEDADNSTSKEKS